jgi:hypothetical protein
MPMFEFASIENRIQMKWMKVMCKMKNTMNKEFQHSMELTLYESPAPAGFWTETHITASHSPPFILQAVSFPLSRSPFSSRPLHS